MADIVNSLFGLSSQELMLKQREADQAFASGIAGAYQDPASRIGAMIGANLGGGLARNLFNIQDPQIQAARDFESMLAQAQQSSSSSAEAMQKLSSMLAGDPRFARQASIAAMKAQELGQQQEMFNLDKQAKQATIENTTNTIAANKEAQRITKLGQAAYGGYKALSSIKDPAVKETVWNKTLDKLAELGEDVEPLRSIPWQDREKTLDAISASTESVSDRIKQEAIAARNQTAMILEAGRNERFAEGNELKKYLGELGIDARLKALETQKDIAKDKLNDPNKLDPREKVDLENSWRTQKEVGSRIGSAESNKLIKGLLQDELELTDPADVRAAINDFNNIYETYLYEKDEKGYPKYTPLQAQNRAKADIQAGVISEKGILGSRLGSKKKYNSKAKKIIKLD